MEDVVLELTHAEVSATASISPTAVLGSPYRPLRTGSSIPYQPTVVGEETHIGHFCVVGAGSIIERRSIIDDYSKVECNVKIASDCLVIYRATICNSAVIGKNCVIGGFITERAEVGANSRVFGSLIHTHKDISKDWDADEAREPSCKIGERVFVGFSATVIGGISIGNDSYIAANATVTKDVPPNTMVTGKNNFQKRC